MKRSTGKRVAAIVSGGAILAAVGALSLSGSAASGNGNFMVFSQNESDPEIYAYEGNVFADGEGSSGGSGSNGDGGSIDPSNPEVAAFDGVYRCGTQVFNLTQDYIDLQNSPGWSDPGSWNQHSTGWRSILVDGEKPTTMPKLQSSIEVEGRRTWAVPYQMKWDRVGSSGISCQGAGNASLEDSALDTPASYSYSPEGIVEEYVKFYPSRSGGDIANSRIETTADKVVIYSSYPYSIISDKTPYTVTVTPQGFTLEIVAPEYSYRASGGTDGVIRKIENYTPRYSNSPQAPSTMEFDGSGNMISNSGDSAGWNGSWHPSVKLSDYENVKFSYPLTNLDGSARTLPADLNYLFD